MGLNTLTWNKLIIIFFVLVASGTIRPTGAQTVDEAVLSVEKHYRELNDLTTKVSQKNVLKSIGKTLKYEGTLRIKKPGKLRLDYTNGQVILVDGKAALFYSRKSEQVIKRTFTDFEHMNIPVAFLLGAAHIRDDFEVGRPEPKAPRTLELAPRKPGAAMKKLSIQTEESGRITSMIIFDKSGNTTEITFSEAQEGAGMDDTVFTFKVPKGTEIIEQ
jgi:outer membrane lipoprotein carrier protein